MAVGRFQDGLMLFSSSNGSPVHRPGPGTTQPRLSPKTDGPPAKDRLGEGNDSTEPTEDRVQQTIEAPKRLIRPSALFAVQKASLDLLTRTDQSYLAAPCPPPPPLRPQFSARLEHLT